MLLVANNDSSNIMGIVTTTIALGLAVWFGGGWEVDLGAPTGVESTRPLLLLGNEGGEGGR